MINGKTVVCIIVWAMITIPFHLCAISKGVDKNNVFSNFYEKGQIIFFYHNIIVSGALAAKYKSHIDPSFF